MSVIAIGASASIISADWSKAPPRPVDRPVSDSKALAERGYSFGSPMATNTLVVFTDYTCSYCRYYAGVIDSVVLLHPEVKVVERHMPRGTAVAWGAARAAECAGHQGQYPAMRQLLYRSALDTADWGRLAAKAKVADTVKLKRCMADTETTAQIARDTAAAGRIQATGTPTVVLNDLRFGAPPGVAVIRDKLTKGL